MQKAQIVCMDATLTKLRVWPAWQKMKRLSVSAVHEDPATGARGASHTGTDYGNCTYIMVVGNFPHYPLLHEIGERMHGSIEMRFIYNKRNICFRRSL